MKRTLSLHIFVLLLLAACGAPAATAPTQPVAPTAAGDSSYLFEEPPTPTVPAGSDGVAQPQTVPSVPATTSTISIDTNGVTTPIDPRLFGVNVAAWSGPERFSDPGFLEKVDALGATVLRMPGGSWSNAYDWLACETRDDTQCFWPWAARPSDFATLLRTTGTQGIWTVSANGTAKEAAALVAFFNGAVDDTRPIGVDERGRDWKTVGDWARLRRAGGNPEPLGITLWEVGNELYGGKQGTDCAEWGWEDVWTCDGGEYVNGIGSGADRHEGFLGFRTAMRAVDPNIQVGAIGVAPPGEWSNWGNEVIDQAGEALDFYVVHHYLFDQPPGAIEAVLPQIQTTWPRIIGSVNNELAEQTPIAVTEYNLVAFQDGDNTQIMRRAVNALATADTLGQLAQAGVAMANHWNLVNGKANNGTDYGLIDAEDGTRNPAYYAFPLWQRFGSQLLPVTASLPADTTLSVYAGRSDDGVITLLAINKTGQPIESNIELAGDTTQRRGTIDTAAATSLDATTMTFNGNADAADDLADAPATPLPAFTGNFSYTFPAYSISLIKMEAAR